MLIVIDTKLRKDIEKKEKKNYVRPDAPVDPMLTF